MSLGIIVTRFEWLSSSTPGQYISCAKGSQLRRASTEWERDVHGAKVGVLEEGGEVGLRTLLKRHDGVGLEAKVGLEVLGNLAHCGRAAG
jgi:hypothetical protein